MFLNDILFCLHAGKELGFPDLNRTALQRILYLCAALAPMNENFDWGYDFSSGKYGPYTRFINDAADRVTALGFAEYVDFSVKADNSFRASYRITERGSREVQFILTLTKERKRSEWIHAVLKALEVYGSSVINKIVSREPSFQRMKERNKAGVISLSAEDNRSIGLIDSLTAILQRDYQITLNTSASKMMTFFDFLSSNLKSVA